MFTSCPNLYELDINATAKNWSSYTCAAIPENCYLIYPIGVSDSELGITYSGTYYDDVVNFKGGKFGNLYEDQAWSVTDFIDLGLPSKTMWNLYNVGSMHPEYHGKYYGWSEIVSKSDYTWDNYSQDVSNRKNYDFGYWNGNQYIVDGGSLSYGDYVYAAGIPTKADFTELVNNCTLTEETLNGVKGVVFTSKKNNKCIFLPYSGSCYDGKTPANGTSSYYWTSTSYDSQKAYAVSVANGKVTSTTCQKRTGLPYRSVARYVRPLEWQEYPDYWEGEWSNSGNFYIDGISNVKGQTSTDNTIYTLQGVKVEGKPQPGIYVKNGRKVVVK